MRTPQKNLVNTGFSLAFRLSSTQKFRHLHKSSSWVGVIIKSLSFWRLDPNYVLLNCIMKGCQLGFQGVLDEMFLVETSIFHPFLARLASLKVMRVEDDAAPGKEWKGLGPWKLIESPGDEVYREKSGKDIWKLKRSSSAKNTLIKMVYYHLVI